MLVTANTPSNPAITTLTTCQSKAEKLEDGPKNCTPYLNNRCWIPDELSTA